MATPMQVQNQQGPPQQAPNPAQAAQLQHAEIDPVAKFKNLLPRLKESLGILFKSAGEVFRYHATQDSGTRPGDSPQQKFEKSLEEFYALCDQIEINLKLALEMHSHFLDSMRYSPFPVVSSFKMDTQQEGFHYPQYLLTVRTQINCATEIHDVLTEFATKMADQPTS
ncbi:mediator of RNA polymerase II transcription subunit 29 [Patella vulgata]|uniref:mediator of RNA polymerase II transcription subunit 29 n=1 Tax=Patella vulgata TaxID=6465 RepID=UPI00218016BA|nr:mediator of RNA polymerase II transcription subunit 29 [Patella vulgata]